MRDPDRPALGWTFRPPPRPRMGAAARRELRAAGGLRRRVLAIPYLEIYRDAFRLTLEVWSDGVVLVQSPVLVADQSGELYDVGQEGGFGTVGVKATHDTSYEPLRPSTRVLALGVPLLRIDARRERTKEAAPFPQPFGTFLFAIPV